MKVDALERGFRYNGGLRLPDPNPNLTVEEAIDLYATTYPEITTAAVEGPEVVGNKLVYRLTRAIGTKG
jgi:PRTRC genetic system protein C